MSKTIYKIGKVETDEDGIHGVLVRYPSPIKIENNTPPIKIQDSSMIYDDIEKMIEKGELKRVYEDGSFNEIINQTDRGVFIIQGLRDYKEISREVQLEKCPDCIVSYDDVNQVIPEKYHDDIRKVRGEVTSENPKVIKYDDVEVHVLQYFEGECSSYTTVKIVPKR